MSNPRINLIGQRFGRWKVLEFLGYIKGQTLWRCECTCGEIKNINSQSLQKGKSTSCGCRRNEILNSFDDLSGRVFGRWTVLNLHKLNKNNSYIWTCKCSCGNIKNIVGGSLRSGKSKSCGCLQKEILHKRSENLEGKIFNNLLVLGRDTEYDTSNLRNRSSRWICRCKCGNIVHTNSNELKTGSTKSCGCIHSAYIATRVKEYFHNRYDAISEYKIIKNIKTGNYLPYDLFIPYKNIFIEIHGKQHYDFTKYFHKNLNGFRMSKYRDRIKKKYAEENGVYIEVDLRKIKTPEEAIQYIESIIASQ